MTNRIMEKEKIENLRQNYQSTEFSEKKTAKNPIEQFEQWFNDALNAIREMPAVYDVLGEHFFIDVLAKNKLREDQPPLN